MKRLMLAVACAATFVSVSPLRAAELSPAGKKLIAYGSVGILVGLCKLPMTPEQTARAERSIDEAGANQSDFATQDAFSEQIKELAGHMAAHKDEICPTASDKGVDALLDEADAAE